MQLMMKKKNFDNTSLERKQSEIKYKERHTTNNIKPTEKTVYGCRGLIDNIFFLLLLFAFFGTLSFAECTKSSIN